MITFWIFLAVFVIGATGMGVLISRNPSEKDFKFAVLWWFVIMTGTIGAFITAYNLGWVE